MAYAGRVDEAECDAMDIRSVFNDVTCGAVDIAHDGFILVKELIEKSALSYIRFTYDSHRYSLFHGNTFLERIGKGRYDGIYFLGQGKEFFTVGEIHILVTEIKFQFKQGSHLQQLFPKFCQFTAEVSAQLAQCHLVGSAVLGRHQMCQGFRLAQIHLAVHKGTHGVFSTLSLTATVVYEYT